MPLVRFQIKNEYGLGDEEVYNGVNDENDPKYLLEGVTVAGLVGILRQLGDLAEFAAEVFHDLQEQVMTTAARSHKMIARVHHLEASVPAIEKAVLAQKSHILFAYTNGSDWHPRIQTHRNHFVYSDLPRFIMDTYEECRDPPNLYLLDKFDKGGPGSCLRRYSDPSYFKEALATSEQPTRDKALRDKTAWKSWKKGLQRKRREASHGVSISDSGSITFASPTSCSQYSAAETISTSTMKSKSEQDDGSTHFDPKILETQSMSSDSKSKLVYPGYVSHVNVSFPGDHADQELRSKLNDGSILVKKQEKDEYYGFSESSSEPSITRSSFVSCDEMEKMLRPARQESEKVFEDKEKASELLPSSSDKYMLKNGAPMSENIDIVSIVSDASNKSSDDDDADSFEDALNTMESEAETDVECQTKRELSSPKLESEGIECETGHVHEMNAQTSDSSDAETCTSRYSSSHKQRRQNFSNSVSSDNLIHIQQPQVKSVSSDEHVSVTSFEENTDRFSVPRETDFESANKCPTSSDSNISSSEVPLVDKIVSQPDESEESCAKISEGPSVKFWTNGGLLGLQPSKPPDFKTINIDSRDSKAGKDEGSLSSETVVPKSYSSGPEMLVKTPENDDSSKAGKDEGSLSKSYSNKHDEDYMSKMNSGVIVMPEDDVDKSGGPYHTTSSITNVKGHFLAEEISAMKTGKPNLHDNYIMQQGRNEGVYQASPERNPSKQFNEGSPVKSTCSSPPLQHMNISVPPLNVPKSSALKLKFPDEHHFYQRNKDAMFPSFQLLPELSTSVQSMDYESDDDTFYRSSPDMSEELMSQQSHSNSEECDFEETPRSTKNSSHRVSSDESISSAFEEDDVNDLSTRNPNKSPNMGFSSFRAGPVLDFPSFDTMEKLTNKQEMEIECGPKDDIDLELQYRDIATPREPNEPIPQPALGEPTPPSPPDESTLPPLPPMEWRTIKHEFSVEENEQNSGYSNKPQVPVVILAQSLKTDTSPHDGKQDKEKLSSESIEASDGEDLNEKEDFWHQLKNKDQEKSSRSIETTQSSNDKDLCGREDLMHQIRSKSFILRSTTTSRPTLDTSPTANTKVAALLEKATSFHQAFVDGGEEDDSWTDG